MVDAVSTITVLSSASRQGSRNAAASVIEAPAQNADEGFVSSHIRVDNLQNVAILEYRSSETGEVVQQYPTQKQIDAFKRAESLETKRQTVQAPIEAAPQQAAPVQAPVEAPQSSAPAETTTSILA